jgi:hypothetical protein
LSTVSGSTTLSMGYDANGNVTSKSDVGSYAYVCAAPDIWHATIIGSDVLATSVWLPTSRNTAA